ncbi:C40 family peptidase [Nonomuraea sp. NPDC047529]|uniref:C40 family peptidase n=1 Tax=Nonomuraea sp. NPDC047529 TaxID=3155623 RepID=UPI00340D97A7
MSESAVRLTAVSSTAEAATTRSAKSAKSARSAKAAKAARQKVRAHKAVAVAKHQIGDPYRYGATGPGAFDCSGLVQYAWKKAGVRLPRVTSSQFARIRHKVSWRKLKPGDLMFFNGLGHVGMYVGHGKMIHSPRTGERVRIDKLGGWRKSSFVGAVRPGA